MIHKRKHRFGAVSKNILLEAMFFGMGVLLAACAARSKELILLLQVLVLVLVPIAN